jgi:hypothetical protein
MRQGITFGFSTTQEPAMETLTRLVAESLARHGFDRPVDYRRLEWSRWFRCESHHSLLVVPSKPGVFALAEEIMDLGSKNREAEDRPFSAAPAPETTGALAPETAAPARMLAVTHFFEDDDMAFVLDRMLSNQNPMRAPLASRRYFIRYVVIADSAQRRGICNALNQWIASSAEKATGIGTHFASSLEWAHPSEPTSVETASKPALSEAKGSVPTTNQVGTAAFGRPASGASAPGNGLSSLKPSDERIPASSPRLNSAVATTIHFSSSFPSGF